MNAAETAAAKKKKKTHKGMEEKMFSNWTNEPIVAGMLKLWEKSDFESAGVVEKKSLKEICKNCFAEENATELTRAMGTSSELKSHPASCAAAYASAWCDVFLSSKMSAVDEAILKEIDVKDQIKDLVRCKEEERFGKFEAYFGKLAVKSWSSTFNLFKRACDEYMLQLAAHERVLETPESTFEAKRMSAKNEENDAKNVEEASKALSFEADAEQEVVDKPVIKIPTKQEVEQKIQGKKDSMFTKIRSNSKSAKEETKPDPKLDSKPPVKEESKPEPPKQESKPAVENAAVEENGNLTEDEYAYLAQQMGIGKAPEVRDDSIESILSQLDPNV